MNHLLKVIIFLWMVGLAESSWAEEKFKFSGFGTLGLAISDSDTHGYRRDVRSDVGVFSGDIDFKNNSLLGLQLDAQLTERLDFSSQIILRDLPKSTFNRYLTQAFFRFNASPNWSFRAGRMAPDLFLMTEYRDIGFSYPWAAPPSEVYGIVPNRHFDGVDATYSTKMANGTLSTKLFTGKTEGDVSTTETLEKISLDNIQGVSVTYDNFNWSIQAKISRAQIAQEIQGTQLISQQLLLLPDFIWPNASSFNEKLKFEDERLYYASVNGRYAVNNWTFNGELARVDSDSFVIPKINSGYVGVAYIMGSHQVFTSLAFTNADNFSFNEPNVNVELIPELIAAIDSTLNFYSTNQETLAVGWRWDVTSNMATTIQLNRTKVDAKGSTLWWTPDYDLSEETINALLLNVSFVF